MLGRSKLVSMMVLAAVTAVFTTICDGIHVLTGTLTYSDPLYFGQSWFVFPGFTLVFFMMMVLYDRVFIHLPIKMDIKESTAPGKFSNAVESFLIFILIYMMSGFGSEYSLMLSFIFYGAFLIRLRTTYERPFILIFAIVLAIGGILGEGLLAVGNLIEYSHQEIFHVPLWLGGVYLHGALALREMMRYFIYTKSDISRS